jgi:hypothetical protein
VYKVTDLEAIKRSTIDMPLRGRYMLIKNPDVRHNDGSQRVMLWGPAIELASKLVYARVYGKPPGAFAVNLIRWAIHRSYNAEFLVDFGITSMLVDHMLTGAPLGTMINGWVNAIANEIGHKVFEHEPRRVFPTHQAAREYFESCYAEMRRLLEAVGLVYKPGTFEPTIFWDLRLPFTMDHPLLGFSITYVEWPVSDTEVYIGYVPKYQQCDKLLASLLWAPTSGLKGKAIIGVMMAQCLGLAATGGFLDDRDSRAVYDVCSRVYNAISQATPEITPHIPGSGTDLDGVVSMDHPLWKDLAHTLRTQQRLPVFPTQQFFRKYFVPPEVAARHFVDEYTADVKREEAAPISRAEDENHYVAALERLAKVDPRLRVETLSVKPNKSDYVHPQGGSGAENLSDAKERLKTVVSNGKIEYWNSVKDKWRQAKEEREMRRQSYQTDSQQHNHRAAKFKNQYEPDYATDEQREEAAQYEEERKAYEELQIELADDVAELMEAYQRAADAAVEERGGDIRDMTDREAREVLRQRDDARYERIKQLRSRHNF